MATGLTDDGASVLDLPEQLVNDVFKIFVDDGVGIRGNETPPDGRHRRLDLDVGVVEIAIKFGEDRLFVGKKLFAGLGSYFSVATFGG